ncbi:3-oxoacyl-[acyl-carrier-protein] reductase [soil metagenome]
MNIDLAHKIALVTGGSSELGRTMVRTLAACGADVAIHFHRNKEMAETLRQELIGLGRRAMIVQADVGQKDEVFAMRDAVMNELGVPNVIVNNAVIPAPWKKVLDMQEVDFEGQYRTSVLHNLFMTQAFVPAMIERKGGRVIAISTECAMQNFPTHSAYVAGKRGMDGLLRVLAKEIGEHQITVNQVAPGWTISDKYRAAGTEKQEGYEKSVPLKRRGTDQEIANVVAFLASDLASFITGAYIPVSGGNVMPAI